MTRIHHGKHATRVRIRSAFLSLLREKPIQSISIKSLCELAQISRGTFYAHYADIYDLLEQIEADMMREMSDALQPLIDAAHGHAEPLALTTRIFEVLKENSDLCIVTLGEYGDKSFAVRLLQLGQVAFFDVYHALIANASQQQVEYYYAFISAGCIGLLRKWLDGGMRETPAEIAAMTEGIMLRGIYNFNWQT